MRPLLLAVLAAPAAGFHALLGAQRDGPLRHETRSVPFMAGGTPRVPWKAPGMDNPQWIDVFNRMYRERIMFMGQNIDDNFANTMISVMLYLESEDANSPVAMYFNVAGGVMKSGLAMYDTMRIMPYDIQTVNMGICAQVSAFLVAGGTKGKRFALPNSRFAMQNPGIMPPLDEKGNPRQRRMQATEMQLEVQETLRDKKRMLDGFATFTGRSLDQLTEDFSRDFYLTADEAVAYGMVDQLLLRKRAEVSV
ncbi:hypothetical protein AB1Y20_017738 [Prymnesium parvum]|uniref:ATP-dependent Clp protease proteolytic subunit n=1 Tax=Prymnesium parvum TaxID=97485 RepID=A0AB34JQA1_PRYPA